MKKIIAILFLSLFCLTTLASKVSVKETGYELAIDCEEGETENKEGETETKEFTKTPIKKFLTVSFPTTRYRRHIALIFTQPVLDRQTPPPDSFC